MSENFEKDGFKHLSGLLDTEEALLLADYCLQISTDPRKRIVEKDGAPYSYYIDQDDPVIDALKRRRQIVTIAEECLSSDVYVHQIKFNYKSPMSGSEISWHDDYTFWSKLDGMPRPNVVTAAILLDRVTHINSPLMLVPGSHAVSRCSTSESDVVSTIECDTGVGASWQESAMNEDKETVVSPIDYTISRQSLLDALGGGELFTFTGEPGDAIFFHGRVIHASTMNISPWRRRMLFISYNDVRNCPGASKRASYISYDNPIPV